MVEFWYHNLFPLGKDATSYRLLTRDYVSVTTFDGCEVLKVNPKGLELLAREAMRDTSFMLRTTHLEKLVFVLNDPEASPNDVVVALSMLRNAALAAKGVLPLCQDTGTATVFGKKGQRVWTGADDEEYLSRGIYKTYTEENLRYSQSIPLNMYDEVDSQCNLPAQIEIQNAEGMEYELLFLAKGGGSANKTALFQETRAVLNPGALEEFLVEKMKTLGAAACPPYHLAFVIGGLSPEMCLKTAKLATTGYLDTLPKRGSARGQAFRDCEMEQKIMQAAQRCGYGAQFGGRYLVLEARIIRLPRHGGSCPIGMAVSCSAHRNIKAKINREGVWLEELERDPSRLIPEKYRAGSHNTLVEIDLNRPMKEILAQLSKYPVGTPLSLTGTLIVARDIAHAKIKERLDRGEGLPEYLRNHPVYYAGPAKTPVGMPSGSFGPTSAGRMDSYVDLFQANGGSLMMIAKGNRVKEVTEACKRHGGFYLGSIGGVAALLAKEHIKRVEVLEYPELGMEAVWKIEVAAFPAFILIDDKGNDLYQQISC